MYLISNYITIIITNEFTIVIIKNYFISFNIKIMKVILILHLKFTI